MWIAASWPSKSAAAVTTRMRRVGRGAGARCGAAGGVIAFPLARRAPSASTRAAMWSRYFPISSRRPDELGDAGVELAEVVREDLVEPLEHRARRAADRVDRVEIADLGEREAERLQPPDEAEALELRSP